MQCSTVYTATSLIEGFNPQDCLDLPDLSACGCEHFGGQQSLTPYRVTCDTVEVPEFVALD